MSALEQSRDGTGLARANRTGRSPAAAESAAVAPPAEDGKPAASIVEYRITPDSPWTEAITRLGPHIIRTGLPRGKTLEIRAFARKKAGDGVQSNLVEVVL